MVDCRGEVIISKTSVFGYGVKIFSESHDISEGVCGVAVTRRVRIDENCWIASGAFLAACWLQHHAFVAGGSVVSGVIVPSYCLVQGNPAQIVAKYYDGRWNRLPSPEPLQPWPERR